MKNTLTIILIMAALALSSTVYSQAMPDSIYYAIQKDDAGKLSKLIDKKNINVCYWNMYTVLSQTIKVNAPNCFDMLLKKGANVNEGCDYKVPVYFVCKYGDLAMLKKLVKKGASLNPPLYKEKSTLLEYAEEYNNQPIIDYLNSLKK